ncbi:hypothetical protein J6590_027761 [Homalodisca vitripennis]|nr:hypothetical protein J6590_027761 [Homalodisca vitripennis]
MKSRVSIPTQSTRTTESLDGVIGLTSEVDKAWRVELRAARDRGEARAKTVEKTGLSRQTIASP